jgi:hypothetical protein
LYEITSGLQEKKVPMQTDIDVPEADVTEIDETIVADVTPDTADEDEDDGEEDGDEEADAE